MDGQTLASDGGTISWSTSSTGESASENYAVTGAVNLGSPYSGDYTIVQAPGNGTALTISMGHLIPPIDTLFGQTVSLPFSGTQSLVGSSSPESLSSSDSASEKVHPGSVVESTHTSSLSVSGGRSSRWRTRSSKEPRRVIPILSGFPDASLGRPCARSGTASQTLSLWFSPTDLPFSTGATARVLTGFPAASPMPPVR
ncbi:MAG: hypothetical protein ACYDBP_12930 [Leptospirales bacterium]